MHRPLKPGCARHDHDHELAPVTPLDRAYILVTKQIATDLVAVVQLVPQHGAQLGGVGHAFPREAHRPLGHSQDDSAALGVGHGAVGFPETAWQSSTRRLEFRVDAFRCRLQDREQVKLPHDFRLFQSRRETMTSDEGGQTRMSSSLPNSHTLGWESTRWTKPSSAFRRWASSLRV